MNIFYHYYKQLIIMKMQFNTKVQYDKSYAWEALVSKYFELTPNEVDSDQMVQLSIEHLKQMSDESHEYGRIRERTLKTSKLR